MGEVQEYLLSEQPTWSLGRDHLMAIGKNSIQVIFTLSSLSAEEQFHESNIASHVYFITLWSEFLEQRLV